MEDIKTVLEWFNLFPYPYKKKAFAANAKSGRTRYLDKECVLKNSIGTGITWLGTNEGHAYWKRVNDGLAHSGLAFFGEPGNADELSRLDKSRKPVETKPPVIPGTLNATLPDAITAYELQKCDYAACSDVKHILATDNGHLYRMSIRRNRGEPPEGAFVEEQTRDRSGECTWVLAFKPPTGWSSYAGNLRWLPAEERFKALNGSHILADPAGLAGYAALGINPTGADKTITHPTPTTEGTTMKNATYSVAKLIIKAQVELDANSKAVKQYQATNAANLAYINAVRDLMQPGPDGKDKPELAALRAVELPKAVAKLAPADSTTAAASRSYFLRVTTKNIYVMDHTVRLKRIITDLGAQSGDEIAWNEDVDFVLADFTEANGSETDVFTDDISIPAPRS